MSDSDPRDILLDLILDGSSWKPLDQHKYNTWWEEEIKRPYEDEPSVYPGLRIITVRIGRHRFVNVKARALGYGEYKILSVHPWYVV